MAKGRTTIAEELLLNVETREMRVAHLQHGRLHDLIVERKKTRQMRGNVYRGRVKNILQNIQSAFIDIGEPENGFIHVSDIIENRKKLEQTFDMDFDTDFNMSAAAEGEPEIEDVLKIDEPVIVQVVKEAIGTKGARLTSRLSVPGRYLVLLPNTPHCGVSRKIEDRSTRERLKRAVRSFTLPTGMGVICRTVSQNATNEALLDEAEELLATWEQIREKFQETDKPMILYEESDLLKRTVLQAVDKKIGRILIDDYKTFQRCKKLYERYSEEHPIRIEYYRDNVPMYERFNVEREIDRALKRKIWLSGGGYLYFDRTEAMYTIDVNSGRGGDGASNVEEALVQINLDAAEEIARQLRIRNIGGLVICDFIDMRSRKNQRRVLDRLRDCMKGDAAKCTILGMSEFGLVEMTRQRSRESLAQTLYQECSYCQGKGTIQTHESVSINLERSLKRLITVQQQFGIRVLCHPYLLTYIEREDKKDLVSLADELNCQLEFATDDTLHLNDIHFFSSITGKELD